MKSKRIEIFLLLLPAVLFLIVFRLYPIFTAFATSLFRTAGVHRQFAGISNYRAIFTDPFILESFYITLKFNLIINPVQTLIALIMALFLYAKMRGKTVFKIIFFAPVVIPMAVASVIWLRMLDPHSGLINGIITAVGLPPQKFLASPQQALGCIIAMATWKGVGFWMVFFLAGLQNIPASILDSAKVDGAGYLRTLLFIILPLLKRTTAFVLAADTAVNLLLFAPVYMMTRGGPLGTTNLLMYEAYKTAFVYLDWGKASSITVVATFVSLAAVFLEIRMLRAHHEY